MTPVDKFTRTLQEVDRGPRRSGRTTRLVDAYIQILFKTGKVVLYDHHYHERANEHIARIFFRRLEMEHNLRVGREIGFDQSRKIVEIGRSHRRYDPHDMYGYIESRPRNYGVSYRERQMQAYRYISGLDPIDP